MAILDLIIPHLTLNIAHPEQLLFSKILDRWAHLTGRNIITLMVREWDGLCQPHVAMDLSLWLGTVDPLNQGRYRALMFFAHFVGHVDS